jgi:hypothetical protein
MEDRNLLKKESGFSSVLNDSHLGATAEPHFDQEEKYEPVNTIGMNKNDYLQSEGGGRLLNDDGKYSGARSM